MPKKETWSKLKITVLRKLDWCRFCIGCICSKVTAISLDGWIWPTGPVASGRVCPAVCSKIPNWMKNINNKKNISLSAKMGFLQHFLNDKTSC